MDNISLEMDQPFQQQKRQEEADFLKAVEQGLVCDPEEVKELVNSATDLQGNVPSDLVCLICTFTVCDPMKCRRTECEELFCKTCISQWLEQHLCCPNCKQETGFEPIGRKLRSLMSGQIVLCKCKEAMTYEKLTGEHKLVCLNKQMPCPLRCGQTISSKQNPLIHYSLCPKSMQQCSKCQSVYPLEETAAHRAVCPEERVSCENCLQEHKRKEIYEVCPEVIISCNDCQAQMKRKDLPEHKEACPMQQVTCMRCMGSFVKKDEHQHDCIAQQSQYLHVQAAIIAQQQQQIQQLMEQLNEQKQIIGQLCLANNGGSQHKWQHGECSGKRCTECGKVEGVLRTMHLWYNGQCQQCGLFEEQPNLLEL